MRVETVERFSGRVDVIREELDGIAATEKVMVVCPTDAEIQRLGEILAKGQLAESGRLQLVHGFIRDGFRLVGPGVIVLGSHQLFAREDPATAGTLAPKRKLESRAIDSFLD